MINLIKRYYFVLAAVALFLLFGCDMDVSKDPYLERPKFEFQKTYLLRQAPLYFAIHYNVWKSYPVNMEELDSIQALKDAKIYKAFQRIELLRSTYDVEDRVNKKKYVLKEEDKIDNKIVFSLQSDNKEIGKIAQVEAKNILKMEFTYKNRVFQINGSIRRSPDTIYAFVYEIKDKDRTLGVIFKEYKYFANEYEVTINREFGIIEDPIFINLGIYIDHILRNSGYQYK